MWNLKAKIESDDLNKQLQVNEKEAVDEKKKPSESQQIKPNLMEESINEHYYQIKDKLFTEIINELNLKAVQDEKDNSSVRNAIKGLVDKLCNKYQYAINDSERARLTTDIQDDILGLGPLEHLLSDSEISEIMVNRSDQIYVEKKGQIILTNDRFSDDKHLLRVINKIVSRVGRRVDELTPMVDARLEDGSRFNAIIPPIAIDGPAISIRKFSVVPLQMEDLIKKNTLAQAMAEFLSGLVKAKTNIIISGGTGSGKTTLLNILSGFIPHNERVITIEDTAELQMQQDHVIRLESRPPNIEGKGEVTFRACVKNCLRMRPDRVVLGEIRGEEIIDMLQAMNTGHDGSLSTIHANNPREALSRMENLMSLGGVNQTAKSMRQQISSAVNIIIQVSRLGDGTRKLNSIHEITGMEGDVITSQEIYRFNRISTDENGNIVGSFEATGVRPNLVKRLESYGIKFDENLFNERLNES